MKKLKLFGPAVRLTHESTNKKKKNDMKKMYLFGLIALVLMTTTSCMSVSFGNGDKDTTPTQVPSAGQQTTMNPFDCVKIGGAFKVIYEQGDNYSVRIDASEQAIKEMTVYVKDETLYIRKAVSKPTVSFKNVKIYVTSPVIEDIEIAGSGLFTASQPITAQDLDTEIAGSGQILLTAVSSKDTHIEIAGSGRTEIGQLITETVEAEIAGSGDINLGSMTCKDFKIEIAGSGNVNCDNIDADDVHTEIAGSGNVNLKGTVKHHTKEIAGSGKVNITSPNDTIN